MGRDCSVDALAGEALRVRGVGVDSHSSTCHQMLLQDKSVEDVDGADIVLELVPFRRNAFGERGGCASESLGYT